MIPPVVLRSATGVSRRVVVTAEHASARVPEAHPFSSSPEQLSRLAGTHWVSDLGTEDLSRELHEAYGAATVLSSVSRMVIDVNRPLGSSTLLRTSCDGELVDGNHGASEAERNARVDGIYRVYHESVADVVREVKPRVLLSVHSFTPNYEGQLRDVEVGVLSRHDGDDPVARRFVEAYAAQGYDTRINEPWSAHDGFAHSAEQAAALVEGCVPLMIEVRQDLCVLPQEREKLVRATVEALEAATK